MGQWDNGTMGHGYEKRKVKLNSAYFLHQSGNSEKFCIAKAIFPHSHEFSSVEGSLS